ncbi:hypothetical protein B296_00041101 [Ensete ventricosum]|uniref:Pentatricopeptide repeat-containing protein n=1 Tax=Ensete ventricosum TaxID=4639 RepID=A0A426ZN73_ENSVE|nr:hypothetical protein B296_00041101 [Ensete ventricosum]
MPLPCATVTALRRHLRLAGDLGSLPLARQSHAASITLGLRCHPLVSSALISAYSLLRLPSLSLLVFRHHQQPDIFLHNSLLAAFSRNGLFAETVSFFHQLSLRLSPDQFSLSIAAKAAAELAELRTGLAVHSLAIRLGFDTDTILSNSLMLMYFRCKCATDAYRLFDEMPARSVASWNALILELAEMVDVIDVAGMWELVRQMQSEGMKPDSFTISTILTLCGFDDWSQKRGKEIHCFILRNSLDMDSDFHVRSCLIDMYSRVRRVDLGRRVFDGISSNNVVVCTAMVAGYVENGEYLESLKLFQEMTLRDGTMPNKITLVTILPAVGLLASLVEGKQIHGFAIRLGLNSETSLNNALIDMYSKCGTVHHARCIFDDESWNKDIISWSSMISCYGIHGKGDQAITLFRKLSSLNFKLNHITSLAILSACSRGGLAMEGLEIYNSLVKNHAVMPTVEICSCVVDMLGRAGQLDHALVFINSMQIAPSPSIWGALFGASVIHNDQKMQDLAYNFLIQLEPDNPSNFVSASNLHASSEKWDFVAQVRTKMKEKGLKKMPGSSWVTV